MYLDTRNNTECFGCEACAQICGVKAIYMKEDDEGFRYPMIDAAKCVNCGLCRKVCPYEYTLEKEKDNKYVFGGYIKDEGVRFNSTSGGAFSAIVDSFCDDNYVIFGAESEGLRVFHSYITDKEKLEKYRKSKYTQSVIGFAYKNAKKFLEEGKRVLFSGTPCQIAGLLALLGDTNRTNLLTIEVVCEGVPSPIYFRKMEIDIASKYGERIESLDYRYKGKNIFSHGTWDFEKMRIEIGGCEKSDLRKKEIKRTNKKRIITKDRWFNPFWSIWLQHLMSRPSCYKCPFATSERVADITLGDLWGVHQYCPELYGKNGGSSLVVCNTEKGRNAFIVAKKQMYGHELKFEDALKYQGPMRKPIAENSDRDSFMDDLKSDLDFKSLNKKWAKPPTLKLLFQKYVWGNRQKVFVWHLTQGKAKNGI